MKRYQWMGIMLSLVLLLCSCGTDKEVEKKAGESTSTPSATASVTPLISEDEAFSEAEKIVKTMTIEQKSRTDVFGGFTAVRCITIGGRNRL